MSRPPLRETPLGPGGVLRRLEDVGENAGPQAFASITLHGARLDPAAWTAFFGVPPENAWRKGEAGVRPRLARQGCWSVSSRAFVTSDALEPHVVHLIRRLQLPRPDLNDRLIAEDSVMRVFCFFDNPRGDRVPEVSAALREVLAACGIGLVLDEYPQPIRFLGPEGPVEGWI